MPKTNSAAILSRDDVESILSGLDSEKCALRVLDGHPVYLGKKASAGLHSWPDFRMAIEVRETGDAYGMPDEL